MKVRVAACEGSHFFLFYHGLFGEFNTDFHGVIGGGVTQITTDFLCSNTDHHG